MGIRRVIASVVNVFLDTMEMIVTNYVHLVIGVMVFTRITDPTHVRLDVIITSPVVIVRPIVNVVHRVSFRHKRVQVHVKIVCGVKIRFTQILCTKS